MSAKPEACYMALVVAALAPFAWQSAYNEDQFLTLSNGLRQLHGAVLYRDFFDFTAPLSHWLAALLFLVTGPHMWAAQVLAAAFVAVAAWQLYRLCLRLDVGPWLAMLPGLGLLFTVFRIWPGYSHHWLILPFAYAAVGAVMRGLEEPTPRRWGYAGFMAGLSLLCLQSDGLVLLAALVGAMLLHAGRSALRPLLVLAAGLAVPLAAAALYLGLNGALGAAWQDAWVFPLTRYARLGTMNDQRYASDFPQLMGHFTYRASWFPRAFHYMSLYALPLFGSLVSLAWLVPVAWERLRGVWSARRAQLALLALWVIGSFLLSTRGRADFIHVACSVPPALILATVAADRAARKARGAWLLVGRLPAAGLAAYVLTGVGLLVGQMRADQPNWLSLAPPDARVQADPVVQYLQHHLQPGDTITALPYGGVYYFFCAPPATRYTFMIPPAMGFHNAEEFHTFWQETIAHHARYVILRTFLSYLPAKAYLTELPASYHAVAHFPPDVTIYGERP